MVSGRVSELAKSFLSMTGRGGGPTMHGDVIKNQKIFKRGAEDYILKEDDK